MIDHMSCKLKGIQVFIYATFSAVYFFQSHRPFKSLKFDCLSFNPIFSVHYAYAMAKQRLERRESSFRSGQESVRREGQTVEVDRKV